VGGQKHVFSKRSPIISSGSIKLEPYLFFSQDILSESRLSIPMNMFEFRTNSASFYELGVVKNYSPLILDLPGLFVVQRNWPGKYLTIILLIQAAAIVVLLFFRQTNKRHTQWAEETTTTWD
jgi:hypothetical protein